MSRSTIFYEVKKHGPRDFRAVELQNVRSGLSAAWENTWCSLHLTRFPNKKFANLACKQRIQTGKTTENFGIMFRNLVGYYLEVPAA